MFNDIHKVHVFTFLLLQGCENEKTKLKKKKKKKKALFGDTLLYIILFFLLLCLGKAKLFNDLKDVLFGQVRLTE